MKKYIYAGINFFLVGINISLYLCIHTPLNLIAAFFCAIAGVIILAI